jgi:phosphatidate cytidylyltransferase
MKKKNTMAKRILGIAIIAPIGVALVIAGGWIFTIGTAAILAIAAWEFWSLFQTSNYTLHKYFLMGSAILCAIGRYTFQGQYFEFILLVILFIDIILTIYEYEKQENYQLSSFGYELAGLVFIAFFGSYLVSLRFLPDGKMWVFLAIPAIGCGDIGAFLLGSKFGKHKMSPKVSPNKSIEGYFGGVLFTVLYAVLFTLIFVYGAANITFARAIILGIILGLISPLGDLLESLFKRAFNRKDAGKLIPGHGGILDRIDTWLVGGPVAYFIIYFFWM